MRTRFFIIFGAFALLIVLMICFFARKSEYLTTSSQTNALQEGSNAVSRPSRSFQPTSPSQQNRVSTEKERNYDQQYFANIKADPNFDWKQPINFYGKVVDESGQPVAGATAHFVWNDMSAAGTSESESTSDETGIFSLIGKRGKGLSITVSKAGYYTPPSSRKSFEYAYPEWRFIPDPNSPVIFYLHRKGSVEPLKAHSLVLVLTQDDKPAGFDPIRCKYNPDGPLIFNFLASQADANFNADVRLRITIKGGGIQKAEGEFPFLAPPSGYQPSIEIQFAKDAKDDFTSQYYFCLGEPRQYGRLKLQVTGYHRSGKTTLPLTYWINPSGSENLEDDPAKFIKNVPEYYLQPQTPPIDELN